MSLLDNIRSHLAVANEDQRKRQGAVLLREAATEIERLTLTDAEREAIHWAVGDVADITAPPEKTLRGLLDRTRQATS